MSEWKNPGRVEVGQLWSGPPDDDVAGLDHVVAVDGCVITLADGYTVRTSAMPSGDDYRCVGLEIDDRRFMVDGLIEIDGNVARIESVREDSTLRLVQPKSALHVADVALMPGGKAFVANSILATLNGLYEIMPGCGVVVRWCLQRPKVQITDRPIHPGDVLVVVDDVALQRTECSMSGSSTWTDGKIAVVRLTTDSDNVFRESVRMARKAAERVSLEEAHADRVRPLLVGGSSLKQLAAVFAWIASPEVVRVVQRRKIDAVLAEDARCYPEFAVARKAAVVTVHENTWQPTVREVEDLLVVLRAYEQARWGRKAEPPLEQAFRKARKMHEAMDNPIALGTAIDVYERARG